MKKVFLYQLIKLSPQNTTIKNPNIINGPKGIGSFLFLIFIINKKIDIIAPRIKDKNIARNIPFIPRIKPSTPIKVASPPPIPPLEIMMIKRNNRILKTNPNMLFINSGDCLYNI